MKIIDTIILKKIADREFRSAIRYFKIFFKRKSPEDSVRMIYLGFIP